MHAFSASAMGTSLGLPVGDEKLHGTELVSPLVHATSANNQLTTRHMLTIETVSPSPVEISGLASLLTDPGERTNSVTVAKDIRYTSSCDYRRNYNNSFLHEESEILRGHI